MARSRVRFPSPAPLSRRFASWGWDYLVILAWLLVLFLLVGLPQLLGWIDLSSMWGNQVAADVAITGLTVVPYLLYLILTEIGPAHATWGKRRAGIAVSDRKGGPPRSPRVVVRNLVKVLPWQLGHMGTTRLFEAEVSDLAMWLDIVSLALLATIVVPVILRRPGLHDMLGGTRVAAVR